MNTKYERVKAHIQAQLQSGTIKPGGRLPSIREVSEQWGCSKNTVIRAYADLERQHMIYAVPRSGYYAVLRPAAAPSQSADRIDFSAVTPDPGAMPYRDFQHCLNRAIELYADQLFSYADPQGFPSLRRALEKHLAASQVFAPPERICVVSGSQQALHLLAAMPFPNGKHAVLVEQPTYHGMLRSLDLLGVTVLGIARTMDGIDLEELERHFRSNNIKFFYTVPRYHNPLGASYTQEQKKEIARLANKYDVYIVEDDYLADMEIDRKADPIYSCDQSGHTVYLKSFSKIMLPGLRLATAVLPQQLIETFRLCKASCDSGTATLSQAALEIYLNCGMFDRHAVHVRERYRARMNALRTACGRYLAADIRTGVAEGGIFTRIAFPDTIDAHDLTGALRQHNVLVTPSDRCYLRAFPKDNGIRISIIRTEESQIEKGIRLIGELAEDLRHKKTSWRGIEWI
jgi:DNA-binding transcriptional MocR family regulator